MSHKRAYIGTVELYQSGKIYGATTRQVNAKNKEDAKRILKKNFKWGNNVVKVTDLKLRTEVRKERGFY